MSFAQVMAVFKPGWGVVIQGEPTDLKKWASALKENFDPWVEIRQGETVLRSTELDKLTSSGEVHDRAPGLIALLNGAVALFQSARHPILFTGSIVRFAHDGTMHQTLMVGPGQIRLRGEGALLINDNLVTVVGPDGKPRSPPPPQPSEVQHWIKLVERDPWLTTALVHFGRGRNWFDIYKALECLFEKAGSQHAFWALNREQEKEIKRLKVRKRGEAREEAPQLMIVSAHHNTICDRKIFAKQSN